MDEVNSPILSIPGFSYRMETMIITEIGDFCQFDSPDKILAFAGMSPSTYQSGQFDNCHSRMESVVLGISDMPNIILLHMFAYGIQHLRLI